MHFVAEGQACPRKQSSFPLTLQEGFCLSQRCIALRRAPGERPEETLAFCHGLHLPQVAPYPLGLPMASQRSCCTPRMVGRSHLSRWNTKPSAALHPHLWLVHLPAEPHVQGCSGWKDEGALSVPGHGAGELWGSPALPIQEVDGRAFSRQGELCITCSHLLTSAHVFLHVTYSATKMN